MCRTTTRYGYLTTGLFALTAAIVLAGCELAPTEVVDTGGVAGEGTPAIIDLPADLDSEKNVCDPFANSTRVGSDLDHGIVAKLSYLDGQHRHYHNVADYQANGTAVDATLFFGNFNVMTRSWDRGFVTQSGTVLKNAEGTPLYEYFSLHFETKLALRDGDRAGRYQFALLADDGAILQINEGHGFNTLVNNDGTHPTRMECSSETVSLEPGKSLPLVMDYYQGPRYHVALVLLWRFVPDGQSLLKDKECGKSGNGKFFDYNSTPSVPTKTFRELMDRGWQIVPAQNFELPDSVATNPCAESVPVTTTITKITPDTAVTSSSSTVFEFVSNHPDASFQCSLDGAPFAACVSPQSYAGLAEGQHEFQVYAVDRSGAPDAEPESYSWTVRWPNTVIESIAPLANPTSSTSITLSFGSNYGDSTFRCRLDGAAASECSSPMQYSGLAEGQHTFEVFAIDPWGYEETSPATYTWTVQAVNTTITHVLYDSPYVNQRTMTFDFAANYVGATFFCSLDGSAYVPCTSPASYSNLPDGLHTFRVYAVDSLGNTEATPAEYSWSVDLTWPRVMSVSTTSTNTTVLINWTTNEPATSELWWGLGVNRTNHVAEDAIFKTSHGVSLSDLLPDSVYTFQIGGHDRAGNIVSPVVRAFSTQE